MQEQLKETEKTLVLSWPSPQDYNEAVQNPASSFVDSQLAHGQPELDVIGLPRPTSGMFATVYKFHADNVDWAVRCFLQSKPDQIYRYTGIQKALNAATLSCMVHFDLQEKGIRVSGQCFPILKMEWCSGEPLNQWLEHHLKDKAAIEEFLERWREVLRSLGVHGIAHGDLQHGNVLIQDGEIKLVDFDGIYVPEFAGMESNELGHRNYQHPARTERDFGSYLDNFSAWLIYLSVLISGCDPHIYLDFDGGDECILFRRQDLEAPNQSELFYVLEHHHNPQIRECSRTLRYLLSLSPDLVPGLEAPIAIPDDFPQFQGTLSNMPDWVAASENNKQESGKQVMVRRRRRKFVPYERPVPIQETGPGNWIYDENGLVFKPHTQSSGTTAQNSIVPRQLHSPLLDSWGQQAGSGHLPLIDDPDITGSSQGGDQLSGAKLFLVIAACLCALFGLIPAKHTSRDSSTDEPISRVALAERWMDAGNPIEAERNFLAAAAELEKSTTDKQSMISLAKVYDGLGQIHQMDEKYDEAEDNYTKSKDYWKRYSGDRSIDYADVLVRLGYVYQSEGKNHLAEETLKEAINLLKDNGNVDSEYMQTLNKDYLALVNQNHLHSSAKKKMRKK